MPRVPRGGCGDTGASAMSWAKLGEKGVTVAANTSTDFDMDSASGWSFFTNDAATFVNGANVGGIHGISALPGGVYEAWFFLQFTRNAALVHDTRLAFMAANEPSASSVSDWVMTQVVANLGAFSSGIDAALQYWHLFHMGLANIPDGPPDIPSSTWTISGEHNGGGNATAYPSLYVKRIAAALPGGIS